MTASNTIQLGNSSVTSVVTSGTVSATGFTGPLTGNASTATKLAATKNINGVAFDGSANITIAADANTLTGTTLASNVVSSSLTGVGTITSGTWSGTTIAVTNGGTGVTSSTGTGSVVLSNTPTLVSPVIGAATGTSLSLTGNLSAAAGTFSSTLSAGATTLSSLTTTGAATFSSTVSIPTSAGLNKVLTSDASGGATWNANPNAAFRLVSSSASYTVSATDDKYVIYTNGATGTISLPAISSTMSGKEIVIKNISNFNVTINANGSQKIVADFANNAATSAILGVEASNNWVKLIADGTNSQWILFRALF